MAEQLDSFLFTGVSNKSRRYNWDNWLNGNPWRLKKGIDFFVGVPSFRSVAAQAANKRNRRLQTKVESDDTIVIQALPCKQEN